MSQDSHSLLNKGNLVALVGIVIVAVMLYTSSREPDEEIVDEELDQLVDQIETFYEAVDEVTEDPDTETPEFTPALTGGSMGEIGDIVATSMNANLDLQKQYIATLQSIGWMTLLNPDHLAADESFAASEKIIADAKDAVAKFQALARTQTESVREQVHQVDMPAAERAAFMQGFESSLEQASAMRDKSWGYEHQALSEVVQLATFLHENRDRWTADNAIFVFDGQDALDTFNRHMANVNSIVEQQQQLQQDHINFARERIEAAK